MCCGFGEMLCSRQQVFWPPLSKFSGSGLAYLVVYPAAWPGIQLTTKKKSKENNTHLMFINGRMHKE